MIESKLENVLDIVETAVRGPMLTVVAGGALAATIGSLGFGLYEGYTGTKMIGLQTEVAAPIIGMALGYVTPIVAMGVPYKDGSSFSEEMKRLERNNEGLGGASPSIGGLVSLACYGVGYTIGKLGQ